jgi:hypothetical protein
MTAFIRGKDLGAYLHLVLPSETFIGVWGVLFTALVAAIAVKALTTATTQDRGG